MRYLLTSFLPLALMGCPKTPAPEVATPAGDVVPDPVLVSVLGEAMGGVLRVEVRCPSEAERVACMDAAVAARKEVERLNSMIDVWNTEGDIARLNTNAGNGPVSISKDTYRMLVASQVVAAASGGAFDVTIGALSGLWGIPGADLPAPEVIQDRLSRVSWNRLHVQTLEAELEDEEMSVILDGVVKGDAAGVALEQIPQQWEARVHVATEVAVRGEWEVTMDIPGVENQQAIVRVKNTVLVDSGTYIESLEIGGGHYKQVLDPRTGEMASGANVSIVAHSQGAIADALATTLRITGPDTPAVEQLGAWALLMTDDGVVEMGKRGNAVLDWRLVNPDEASGAEDSSPAEGAEIEEEVAEEPPAQPEAAPEE